MSFRSFLLGLLICFLLSFLLGIERQYRRRFLGLRTMILVSVGSYLARVHAEVTQMVYYIVGEGIEKRQEDFAAEVMSQIK